MHISRDIQHYKKEQLIHTLRDMLYSYHYNNIFVGEVNKKDNLFS